MPRSKTSSQLTELELACVANYRGNQVEAAKAAGVKNAKTQASVIFNRPRVKAAVEKKVAAAIAQSGKDLGKAITLSRNDIINRLDRLSENADSDSVKVSALRELVDIWGLRAKDGKGDLFAGWTEEDLQYYIRTGGAIPPRFRSPMGNGEGDRESSSAPTSPPTPAKSS